MMGVGPLKTIFFNASNFSKQMAFEKLVNKQRPYPCLFSKATKTEKVFLTLIQLDLEVTLKNTRYLSNFSSGHLLAAASANNGFKSWCLEY